ncbi:MSC_0619 family F1-like ATPase alpha subunit [Mycoplasmopsis opalescens]|uniref:MSC_0619 family F1-like ATPase alpha subunit n=1 Tax=Mycoplasmopsis opalescens TaxID=114886 RepID=UPI0004A725E0|nr:ATP F0F1 synthase subunit alpha [Mycoplasmopsis opalescens]
MNYNNPQVSAIFDYIIKVDGQFDYKQRQHFCLERDKNVEFILISANENSAFLLVNKPEKVKINDRVILNDKEDKLVTYTKYFGHIINISGELIYPENVEQPNKVYPNNYPIFNLAHNLMSVKRLDKQLYTGINAIDLLIPIGKGQRELIIGDRQTGKTHIALNAIINQANNGTKCIYVAIGQKKETITRVYNDLKENNALANTIIIDAPANSVYDQFLAPYIGMAHAENISHINDVLIIFDDLTKHANIIREIALLTDKPVGKEAMPSNVFFSHSSLLERSGSFLNRKTITALPILQTVDGDIASLISSNIISITDGQIVTSADLFAQGKLPAINLDLSVSRTGSSVQNRSITKVAGEIGKIYRSYKKHLKLAMIDYDFNKETSILLSKGKAIEKMFNQVGYNLYSTHLMIFMAKLASWNLLQGVKNDQLAFKFIDLFINKYEEANKAFELMKSGKDYDDEIMKNYFAYALTQFSDRYNLGWDINYKSPFLPIAQDFWTIIDNKLGGK